MKFEGPPQPNPVKNPELPIQSLETNNVPAYQENVGVSEADIIAHKEANTKRIAELREQLGLPPEITQVDQNPATPNAEVPEKEVIPEQDEILTPEMATQKLFAEMDEVEIKKGLGVEKSVFLDKITNLLRIASKTEDPQAYKFFRNDSHFQKLKMGNKFLIQNSFDRDLHGKIFAYLDSIGIKTTDEEKREIKNSFETSDAEKRKETLGSYAQNGLLTLKSALEKGVLKETSSTPGDFSSSENLAELSGEEFENVRGYELTAQHVSDTLFYGRNSFFGVVLERGGESIDRASQLPKIEVENRLRNSMIFVVKTGKVEISKRTENVNKEDIIGRDIKPEEIDYLIVDKSNHALAQETYGHLPVKIVEANSVEADIDGLYDGPYTLPNYKDIIDQITKTEGSIWCHIARLPVETYPKESVNKEKPQGSVEIT